MSHDETSIARRSLDALTGLRFVAALVVVVVHSIDLALEGTDATRGIVAQNAVALFFVLSGFVLTWVYASRLSWRSTPAFWWARFARLWPLHVACMAAVLAVQFWSGQSDWSRLEWPRFWTQLGLVHVHVPKPNWAYAFNGPAWSIATETGFYLLFPLVLLAGPKRFPGILLLVATATAGLLGAAEVLCRLRPESAELAGYLVYVNPLFRLLEFVCGMGVAWLFLAGRGKQLEPGAEGEEVTAVGRPRGRRRLSDNIFVQTVVELAALLAAGLAVGAMTDWGSLRSWLLGQTLNVVAQWLGQGGLGLAPFAFLIWVLAWSRGLFGQFLARPVMVYLGEVSFALYLIQLPVILLVKRLQGNLDLPDTVVAGTVIGGSLGLAMILHGLVERPMRVGLLAMGRGDWRGFRRSLTGFHEALWSSGTGLAACLVLLIAGGAFWYELDRVRGPGLRKPEHILAADMFDNEARPFPRTVFVGQAILQSAQLSQTGDRLKLLLLWEVLPGCSMSRFVHLCDEEGAIVRQGAVESNRFRTASPHALIVDEIELKPGQLAGVATIGIGFYAVDKGTAVVDRGVRGLAGRRLEMVRFGAAGPELIIASGQGTGAARPDAGSGE